MEEIAAAMKEGAEERQHISAQVALPPHTHPPPLILPLASISLCRDVDTIKFTQSNLHNTKLTLAYQSV